MTGLGACRACVAVLLALLIWSASGHTLFIEPDPGSVVVVLVVLGGWFAAYCRLWVRLRPGPLTVQCRENHSRLVTGSIESAHR